MFKFLKKNKSVSTIEQPIVENKNTATTPSQAALIAEIHETFFTEVNRLLEFAGIRTCDVTDKQPLLDKAARLQKLGFHGTQEVRQADAEKSRIRDIQYENNSREQLKQAILYFSRKYPLYKFISESSVKNICEKYNLVYGPAIRYIGTVPEKNVAEMEQFKIDEADKCYQITKVCRAGFSNLIRTPFGNPDTDKEIFYDEINKTYSKEFHFNSEQWREEFIMIHARNLYYNRMNSIMMSDIRNKEALAEKYWIEKARKEYGSQDMTYIHGFSIQNRCQGDTYMFEKSPVEIAAPLDEMDMGDSEIKNFKIARHIKIPDPIVLEPVIFQNKKYYLIQTAWGLEASDELVVNEKYN